MPKNKPAVAQGAMQPKVEFVLPLRESKLCPFDLLELDLENPRLQTGSDLTCSNEEEVISALAEIAALDELVTSICTNRYLNLEPLIVYGNIEGGPFKVLEGNRRVAALKLILNPELASDLDVSLPGKIPQDVFDSFKRILVHRVESPEDARDFIGFKHINGPQRWDAYAKAKYVADWYKQDTNVTIDQIAAKMGDNNNTLRSYIYAILALEQADDAKVWSLKDRPKVRGRFAFSHLYTALQREEFQSFLGITGGWSNKPPLKPIAPTKVKELGEVLSYLYGSVSADRPSLIKSQNPDLKDIGLAIVNENARLILKNGGDLDAARDALKSPSEAFHDALVTANLRLRRAIELVSKYTGEEPRVEAVVDEIFDQADVLKQMIARKKLRAKNAS